MLAVWRGENGGGRWAWGGRISYLLLGHLDNPTLIWGHAFRNQISEPAQHVLIVLTTLPTAVRFEDLAAAFEGFRVGLGITWTTSRTESALKRALKEVDGTFLSTRTAQDQYLSIKLTVIRFQNPSIRDFLQNLLLSGENLPEIISSLVFFEQAEWLGAMICVDRTTGAQDDDLF